MPNVLGERRPNVQQGNTNTHWGTRSAKTTHSTSNREALESHSVLQCPLNTSLGHKAPHLPNCIPESIPISTSLKVTSDKDGLSWEPRIPQDNPSQTKDWDMQDFLRETQSAGLLGTAVWLHKFSLFKAQERRDLSLCVFSTLCIKSCLFSPTLQWLL